MLHAFGSSDIVVIALVSLVVAIGLYLHFAPRKDWDHAEDK